MRQPPQCHNGVEVRHRGDFRCQVGPAGVHFGSHRFVRRWQAPHGIGDPDIDQPDIIIAILVIFACRQAEPPQHGEQITASGITGEGAACPVGAAQTWRQPNDQDARCDITERIYRRIVP